MLLYLSAPKKAYEEYRLLEIKIKVYLSYRPCLPFSSLSTFSHTVGMFGGNGKLMFNVALGRALISEHQSIFSLIDNINMKK